MHGRGTGAVQGQVVQLFVWQRRTQGLDAIDQTIESLPSQALTRPYLEAHKAEVKDMLLTEYNEAEAMELFKAEGREDERVNNIRSLMDSLKITARQAMDALRIPADEQDRYMKSL